MFGERIREWATVGADLIWAPRPSGQGKQLRHAWYQNAWLTNELLRNYHSINRYILFGVC